MQSVNKFLKCLNVLYIQAYPIPKFWLFLVSFTNARTQHTRNKKMGLCGFILFNVETKQHKGAEREKIMSGEESGVAGPGCARRRGRRRGVRMSGDVQRRVRAVITDEIRATTDRVINHGLSLREAGERVITVVMSHSNCRPPVPMLIQMLYFCSSKGCNVFLSLGEEECSSV